MLIFLPYGYVFFDCTIFFLIKLLYFLFMLISYFQGKNFSSYTKKRRNKLTCAPILIKKH